MFDSIRKAEAASAWISWSVLGAARLMALLTGNVKQPAVGLNVVFLPKEPYPLKLTLK